MTTRLNQLKALQTQMLSWLQEGNTDIRQAVTGTDRVSADIRLDIYANAYRFRLVEALQETFPALHTLMGDEDFFALGHNYLNHNPSQHFSLRYFGHQLNRFLSEQSTYKEQPVLAEMAQFEWLLREAFDAADIETLSLENLQDISPEHWPEVKFSLHPSLQRIDLNHNVPQLWQAIEQQQPAIEIIQNEYPLAWCIWRKELRTFYRSMDVDEAWAMDAVRSGDSFSEICAGICEWVDEQNAAARVAGFIQSWIQEQFVCDVRL